ncbi:tRNA-modifying protein YgfZ [Erwinia psidii]|uniref:tRNA-modifying protein YgfZ n=1 Tax=Erwinia psidii TaxID=69224 RepID=A0A3N6RVI2_9GAMM|nr:tRNA-modifying protein YgfZ [Erwinia psidii]MCX8956921.1 tRNA-modifying protein YgfZ [Erwinia psidii]MCX8960268.1 tRNA-modifying protein YgfZ [Erwinia psidii]MCX8964552.1 tRNA-modifying protein YgfZ [Erwinia psidii]RQM36954.1 tRNA-modifying protein YgfZ [Erwinia psidii]
MPTFPFLPRQPVASSRLPLTLVSLEEWALVNVTGADRISYLQGQVTLDVAALDAANHLPAAHCDAKGKMWSNLRLFHRGEGLSYLVRRSLRDTQITELKKYAVFSKVSITADDEAVLLGIAGLQARSALAHFFNTLPDADNPVIQHEKTSLLWFALPAERFLVVTSSDKASALCAVLEGQAQLTDSSQWLAMDIEAGFPVIDDVNSCQLIPQATNLQALDAISFRKGCYTGQEMVARAKFRGANKRALYWLAGVASRLPAASDALEIKLGDNWRRTGTVLAACTLDNGDAWVQVVLNNDLQPDSELRVQGDEGGKLTIRPLPYELT